MRTALWGALLGHRQESLPVGMGSTVPSQTLHTHWDSTGCTSALPLGLQPGYTERWAQSSRRGPQQCSHTYRKHILIRVSQTQWISTSFLFNPMQDTDMAIATSSMAGQKVELICWCKWKSATCTTCFCCFIQKDFNFDRLTKEQTESDNQ